MQNNYKKIKSSFEKQVTLYLTILVGIALAGVLSGLHIAQTSSGYSRVLNHVGSLRMHSYHIANTLQKEQTTRQELENLADQFSVRLAAPELNILTENGQNEDISSRYQKIIARWEDDLRHQLYQQQEYLDNIDDYVIQIDALMNVLEKDSEQKVNLLKLTQLGSFILSLITAYLIYNRLKTNFVKPLQEITQTADQLRAKNFKARVNTNYDNELGRLSVTLNEMADELSITYQKLENRVLEKTQKLQSSNNSILLLYKSSTKLHGTPQGLTEHLPEVLKELSTLAGTGGISLCLANDGEQIPQLLKETEFVQSSTICRPEDCGKCITPRISKNSCTKVQNIFTIPVINKKNIYGNLFIKIAENSTLSKWQINLIQGVADIIGTAISLAMKTEQEAQLLLKEERTIIARELHDSLAQALSYQKIQVARIRKLHQKNADKEAIFSSLDDLRDGLNIAYLQLRELLTTFRLKTNMMNLEQAIDDLAIEFKNRCAASLKIDNQLMLAQLEPKEEFHLIQIIRESLLNCAQHANAANTILALTQQKGGTITVKVIDDGIGISENPIKSNHFGLIILQERAQKLGGNIDIKLNSLGGTSVKLTFKPNFHIKLAKDKNDSCHN